MVQPYIPEKRGAIEKVMQGLQVAQAVYGIKSAYDQSKLNDYKMKEYESEKEAQKKLSQNIFTESQAKNLYEASADDKRAQLGKIETKKPDGTIETKDFWFISPERIKQESQIADLNETERKYRLESQYAQGRVRPNDYEQNITVFGGNSPGAGFRKGWDIITNPDGSTKRVELWLKPFRRQNLDNMNFGDGGIMPAGAAGGKKIPLITLKDLKTPEEKAGYRNAIDAAIKKGIAPEDVPYNISIADVYAYNPKKIERDRAEIAKQLDPYVKLMPAVREVDKLIGGIDSDKPIQGSEELRNALRIGTFSAITTKLGWQDPAKIQQAAVSRTSPESKRLWTALSALKSDFNKLKSGLSLTKDELAAAENALGVSEWASDAQLRQGIKTFVSTLKSGLNNVETGYHQASIDAYKENPKSVTSDHPIFQRLDSNSAIVTSPKDKKSIERNAAIIFGGG